MPLGGDHKTDDRLKWLGRLSLPLLIVVWQGAALIAQSRFAPGPWSVVGRTVDLIREGHLLADFGQTLARAGVAFALAMVIGTGLGVVFGRVRWLDRLFSAWVVVGLNLPAIVVAILCYIWLGLTDVALVLAVVLNKVPLVVTTIRAGVRALDPSLDELARVYRMPRRRWLRLILLPQLLPHVMTAARTGLSLVWKIVLVFEVLGSDGGVGFRVGVFFQFFDMTGILAYTVCFVALVLGLEYGCLRPVEWRMTRWRMDQR